MCALFFTYQKCIDFAKKAGLDEGEARNIILARESTDREGIARFFKINIFLKPFA